MDSMSLNPSAEGGRSSSSSQARHAKGLAVLTNPTDQVMSSREIAELTGKRHDNVRADILNMAQELSLTFQEKLEGSDGGRPAKVFLLPKRESLILVSGYSTAMRARIIDRWQELEGSAAHAVPDLRDIRQLAPLALQLATVVQEQQAQLTAQAPKIEALNRIALADGSLSITEAAKALQVQPKFLFNWLSEHQWIYRRAGGSGWIGYQSRIQSRLLEHKVNTVERSDGSEKMVEQCRITSRGMAKLAELMAEVSHG